METNEELDLYLFALNENYRHEDHFTINKRIGIEAKSNKIFPIMQQLKKDGFAEILSNGTFCLTVPGKTFRVKGGYINREKESSDVRLLEKKILELTAKQLSYRRINAILAFFAGIAATILTTFLNTVFSSNPKEPHTQIQIANYPKQGDTTKLYTSDSLININLLQDSIKSFK